jgi:hypothetical protein
MKKLKFTLVMILLVKLFYSCDSKDSTFENSEVEKTNYSEIRLDATRNISKIDEKFSSKAAIENEISKYFITKEQSYSKQVKFPEKMEFKITLAPHYDTKEATFMLTFYQDLANCYDSDILNLLDSKRKFLDKTSFAPTFKQEVNLIFDVIQETTAKIYPILYKENTLHSRSTGFWSCMGSQGKNIARGVATGALTGAASGAYTGATGGTVALPGIGTVAGAVGGAVFGATAGAVGGGATAVVWAAFDCSSNLKLQVFPEERLELGVDKIKFINSILETPEDTSLTFIL